MVSFPLDLYLTVIEIEKRLPKRVLRGSRLVSHEDRVEFSLLIQSLSLASRLVSHPGSPSSEPFSSVSIAFGNQGAFASRVSHGPRNGSSSSPDSSFCRACCSPAFSASGMPCNKPSDDHPLCDQEQSNSRNSDILSWPP